MKRSESRGCEFAFTFKTQGGMFFDCTAYAEAGDPGDYDTPPEPEEFYLTRVVATNQVDLLEFLDSDVIEAMEKEGVALLEKAVDDDFDPPDTDWEPVR